MRFPEDSTTKNKCLFDKSSEICECCNNNPNINDCGVVYPGRGFYDACSGTFDDGSVPGDDNGNKGDKGNNGNNGNKGDKGTPFLETTIGKVTLGLGIAFIVLLFIILALRNR